MNIPCLDTERLRIRPHQAEDWPACSALWGNPEVVRYIGGVPFTPQQVWSRILSYVGHWQWMGYGFWVMEYRASGEVAGELGFAEFRRAIEPPIKAPELGWVLAPRFQGRGLATEAVRAALAWADKLGWERTVCLISPENSASLRVAEKCGFASPTPVDYGDKVSLLLARTPLLLDVHRIEE